MKRDGDDDGTTLAPPMKVWVCGACGKLSCTRYGFDKAGKRVCDPGWDESCMSNCVLVSEETAEKIAEAHGRRRK